MVKKSKALCQSFRIFATCGSSGRITVKETLKDQTASSHSITMKYTQYIFKIIPNYKWPVYYTQEVIILK
jgi:hypothetical protein